MSQLPGMVRKCEKSELWISIGFNSDPDPAFLSMWIRIQIRIYIRIQIQGFEDQNWEKIYS